MTIKKQSFRLSTLCSGMFRQARPIVWGLMGISTVSMAGPGFVNVGGSAQPINSPTYYANSPSGSSASGSDTGTALRKFVNRLPGIGAANANDLGQYIPVAVPEKWRTPGGRLTADDYYELGIVEFEERLHSDLAKATKMRGYVQLSTPTNPGQAIPLFYDTAKTQPIYRRDASGKFVTDAAGQKVQVLAAAAPHALGPLIQAATGTAVRLKVTNLLPEGRAELDASGKVVKRNGDMFLPVDRSLVGTGYAKDGVTRYSENRASVHLHGGDTPWISDGTPYQWFAPAGEADATVPTSVASDLAKNGSTLAVSEFLKGASARNVPDMPDPGMGSMTFYYPNNQSARMLWYHDHTIGLTRVNVAAGMAAPYLISDPTESALVASGALPQDMIPLVFQDKTFVPKDIALQDANWDTNAWGQPGDFWFPHVYETNGVTNIANNGYPQAASAILNDPVMLGGNPAGRWDFGPEGFINGTFPPLMTGKYGQASTTPEAFMDTPLVNGTPYPSLDVQPKAYRFRLLNATNDRFLNLSLFEAVSDAAAPLPNTEVAMVPAVAPANLAVCAGNADPVTGLPPMVDANGNPTCWPASWPQGVLGQPDPLKLGGVPDPTKAGPKMVQVGNETGWLPATRHIAPSPVLFAGSQVAGDGSSLNNVGSHALYMSPAERSDVVIDFSAYAGKTLILYNDSPAPAPGFDDRYDYYTGNADLSGAGGAESTKPGYGPNTRTILQIKVAPLAQGATATAFDYAATDAAVASAFSARNEPPLVVTADAVAALANRAVGQLQATVIASGGNASVTAVPIVDKAIVEEFDPNYGRLNAIFGIVTQSGPKSLAYADRPTEFMRDGETTLWRIAHTGVDTHPVHFHLVNVQIVARVNADGSVEAPDPEELGWKETVKMNPAQDIIVAFRPTKPALNGFSVPPSIRMLDPSQPAGAIGGFTQMDTVTGAPSLSPVVNALQDFSWEYVWHCHILGHEENDFMRVVSFIPNETAPLAPTATAIAGVNAVSTNAPLLPAADLSLVQTTLPVQIAFKDNANNEYAYRIERSDAIAAPSAFTLVGTLTAVTGIGDITTWTDSTAVANKDYIYRVSAVGSQTLFDANNISTGLQEVSGTATIRMATGVIPDTPTALAASAITSNSVTLGWTAGAATTGYRILQSADAGVTWTAAAATITLSTASVTGLVPASDYLFRVIAVNGYGASAPTADVPVRTLASLTAPTMGLASSVVLDAVTGATQVSLVWTNTAIGQTGYKVERFTGTLVNSARAGAVWTTLHAALAGNTTVYSDATAAPGTAYVYRVTPFEAKASGAINLGLSSSQAVTSAVNVVAPTLNSATSSGATVTLSWTDNSTNETSFSVERASVTNGVVGAYAALGAVARTGTATTGTGTTASFADATALAGNVYAYRVKALNVVGVAPNTTTSTSLPSNTLQIAVALSAPTGLTATVGVATATTTPVTLGFTDTSSAETAFEIYRSTDGVTYALLGSVARTAAQATSVNTQVAFSDTTAAVGVPYFYKVRAVQVAAAPAPTLASDFSNPATATVSIAAPGNLTVGLGTATATTQPMTLAWVDNSSNETRFAIERAPVSSSLDAAGNTVYTVGTYAPLAQTVARTTAQSTAVASAVGFTDTTAALNTVYAYRVLAQRVVGAVVTASLPSNEVLTVGANAVAAPGTLVANAANGTSVVLNWIDNSSNETAFQVFRTTTGTAFPATALATVTRTAAQTTGKGTAVTYTDATAAIGTTYDYQVVAVTPTGNLASSMVSATLTLAAPSNVLVTQVTTGLQVSWNDNSNNETGFEVVRTDNASGVPVVTVAAVTSTAAQKLATGGSPRVWIDTTAVPGIDYTYVVRALNLTGGVTVRSADSNPVVHGMTQVTAPGTPNAVISTASRITLTWADLSVNETAFVVERAFTPVGGTPGAFAPLATVARTAAQSAAVNSPVSYVDNLPAPVAQGTYQYQVTAINQTVGAATVNAKSAAVGSNLVDFTVPKAPSGVTGSAVVGSPGTVSVGWTDPAITETGFSVQYATSATFTANTTVTKAIAGANTGSAGTTMLSGLVTGTVYYVRVAASNLVGLSAYTAAAAPVTAP